MLLPFSTPPARPMTTGLICVMLLIVSPVFGGNYAGSPTAFTSGHIELLTILGDSNSDLGNAKYAVQSFSKLTGGKVPNATFYYKGRFSNGKIWGDNVYDAVDDLDVRSYAFGFGTACTANANPTLPKSFPASTQQQAEKYVADLKTKKLTAKRAVALWIGANDLANAFFIFPDGPSKPPLLLSNTEQVLKSVITCILDTASKLIAAGERRIIVWGIQPVQLSPFALVFIKPQPALGPVIANIVTTFNAQLRTQLAALQKASPKGVTLEYFDIYNPLLKALTGKVPGLGIKDFSTPCLALTQNLLNQTITLSAPPCKAPDTVFFYDQVHMNRVVHKKVVAKTFVDFLKAKRYIKKC